MPDTRGITIEFYGRTMELENSIKSINQGLKATKDELKTINQDLKLDPSNVDQLRNKFAKLKQEQTLLKQAIELYKTELSKMDESDIGSKQWTNLQGKISQAQRQLSKVNQELDGMESSGLDNVANSADKTANSLEKASDSALSFGDILKANVISDFIINGLKTIANELKSVALELNNYADDFRQIQVYEKQFESNLKNTADATDDQIASLRKLAKQKERNGVISARAITSAYQELATYVESADAIEGLTDALTDMAAQQYGVDATDESVRNLATTLGKALANGDYSGLTRLGYGFDEVQKKIMKYGTELERVSVLNDVIGSSIGGMNEALAQTDAGKLFQVQQYFDDIKTSIGEVVSELEVGFVEQIMPIIQPFLEEVMQWIIDNKDSIYQTIVDTINYLTSDEMFAFFEDVRGMVEDLVLIIKDLVEILDKTGLIRGAWELFKIVVQGVADIIHAIRKDIEYISEHGIGDWAMSNYNSYDWGSGGNSWSPGWSGGYGALNSGAFKSGGITLNASFNVTTNNVTQRDVEMWSGWLVDSINTKLGEAI